MDSALSGRRIRRLMDELYRQGPLSNQELSIHFDCSPASVTHMLQPLLEAGMVRILPADQYPEERQREKVQPVKRRRKATIQPDPSFGHALVIELGTRFTGLRRVHFDLRVDQDFTRYSPIQGNLVDSLVHEIEVCRNSGPSPLLGVAITIPGRKEPLSGKLAFMQAGLVPEGVDLCREIQEKTSLPCIMENDANALALHERFAGLGRQSDDFVCLYINEGVGLGIVANGRLYEGYRHHAGESGHVIIDPNGPMVPGLPRGSIEAYVSRQAIAATLKEAGYEAPDYQVWKSLSEQVMPGTFHEKLFRGLINRIALLSVNIIHLFAPRHLFVYGPMAEMGELFSVSLSQEAARLTDPARSRNVSLAIQGRPDWKTAMAAGTAKTLFSSLLEP